MLHSFRVNGWYSSPLNKGTPASPGVNLGRVELLVWRAGSGAPFRLGGRGITGSKSWFVRDDGTRGYSLSSLLAYLSGKIKFTFSVPFEMYNENANKLLYIEGSDMPM